LAVLAASAAIFDALSAALPLASASTAPTSAAWSFSLSV
jgi:hypothetical protein